jgi:hypothetical protein
MFLFRSFFIIVLASLLLNSAILDDLIEKIPYPSKKSTLHQKYRKNDKKHSPGKEAQWQKALAFLGYYKGEIDGDLYTQRSFHAITDFHADHHEIATGFLEEADKQYLSEIYRALSLEVYLSYNGKNRRRQAQRKQAALTVLSLYHGKIDGLFKARSNAALVRYVQEIDANSTMTDKEIEDILTEEAKEKIAHILEQIRKTPFDPSKYAPEPYREDMEI